MVKKGLNFKKSKDMATDKRACFFKVMFPAIAVKPLRIPPEFRKHMHEHLPHRGCLRISSGGIWPVKVVKVANEIFLKNGWSEFVRDNSLGNNEFLLFKYEGNLSFEVQIFDATGVIKRTRSRPDPRTSQQPVARRNDQDRPLQNCQNAAKSFTSDLPFFERCMKPYNVQKQNVLNLPRAFCRKYFPAEKTEIVLRDQQGETWKVKYTSYTTNASFLGGWGPFVRAHKLKENDICIFELVGEKEMKVYIYRAGSPPLSV